MRHAAACTYSRSWHASSWHVSSRELSSCTFLGAQHEVGLGAQGRSEPGVVCVELHVDGGGYEGGVFASPVELCVAVCCSALQCVTLCCSVLQCVAVCRSALQCIAVHCSVLQCVAVCCSVLQCVLHCVP